MFGTINPRDVAPFPAGDNATDTFIGGVHFNLTTLQFWNYTLYTNGTLSNESSCFLSFQPYTPPLLLPNGTFVNSSSCYSPINPIDARGGIGIGLAVVYGLCLILVLINLTKHGKLHLPAEKRFYPIGRRWQWYWAIFVCATAMIALFTGLEVDRYYLASIPIVLNAFFWYLMQMGVAAMVWEAVRHWGSWMERQFIDPNPFVLPEKDRRGMLEFWLPLFFYLWLWVNFFLIVPRNWGNIELQRSPEQTVEKALPSATDGRFKAATFCLFVCWLTTAVLLWHSIRHYEDRNRGLFNRLIGGLGYIPFRFVLIMPIALGVVAYQGLSAWEFDLSPQKIGTNLVAMYVGGYVPSLLILFIQIISGFTRQNEDLALIQQRRKREEAVDAELGLVRKPGWWARLNGDLSAGTMRDRILRNVREVGGGRATARNVEAAIETRIREREATEGAVGNDGVIEMNDLRPTNSAASSTRGGGKRDTAPPPYSPGPTIYAGRSEARRSERTMQMVASVLFPSTSPQGPSPSAPVEPTNSVRGRGSHGPTQGEGDRSRSTGGVSMTAPSQQVRSMLDV